MNASCDVVAVARADGQYYVTKKPVRVVIGGCG
jgi:predicted secreted protein